MAAKLKVFQTTIGLRTWVVAVSSRKAALKAWDVKRDLFANGEAEETNEAAAVALAMKSPGVAVPHKTMVVGKLEKLTPATRKTKAPEKAKPPKPDRSALDAAEKALAAFRKQAASRRQAIADEKEDAEAAWAAELKRLQHQEDALIARAAREKAAYDDA